MTTNLRDDWVKAREEHQANVGRVAQAVAAALPGNWTVEVDGHFNPEVCRHIRREYFGLELSLWWDRPTSRMEVRPVAPQIEGERQWSGVYATVDPHRDPKKLAADIQRRVVEPWEPQLDKLLRDQAKTLAKRALADLAYLRMSSLKDIDQRHVDKNRKEIAQGNYGVLYLGCYDKVIDADIKVSPYGESVEFKIKVSGYHEAEEIAKALQAILDRKG